MATLSQSQVADLPPYLRRVHDAVARFDAREAALAVECERDAYIGPATGRVGALAADMAARWIDDKKTRLRVDCFHNHEFWLEVDLERGAVAGRVPHAAMTAGHVGEFRLERRLGGVLRVTHTGCAEDAFCVDIRV